MAKRLLLMVLTMSAFTAQANTIYKCMMDEKVVFSQTFCPQEYSQHKIEYQLGITTEIDSDKRELKEDPLTALLNNQTLSKQKLLKLLDGEIYRLKQENSYFEILRASELQKLDRKRYWQTKPKDDPSYALELQQVTKRFDDLNKHNTDFISILEQQRTKIATETPPDNDINN
ncbi:DUF4124 domain-containing protein [Shewanella polaris]|uniref:DUF4124 domain-containing protein n=1 Tax=Shewanella polaris TaxID=2588449 RepID=A0A4Y5YJ65_9GAMM|nr:DUF4124 domain-containing protein [Shewanella polaris]QDE32513.1 DUF4124 domain-containing protein [Shewanella polaris]